MAFLAVFILLASSSFICVTDGYPMAIDLGSDTMKIALVMPRKPFEIVLNSESLRKTPVAIAFRDKERLFGGAAVALASRSPELVYECIPQLIGKSLYHPSVKLYQSRYPYHNVSHDPATGQLILTQLSGVSFLVEELVAMLFEYARDLAENHAGGGISVRSVVLTAPNFYSQSERRSLIRAAELAGLEVMQLIGDNTAVALNFGITRYSSFNAEVQYYMFFDVGYSSTTATVVSYQTNVSSSSNSGPMLSILGVGFAPTLGTSGFIYRLRDHLVRQFNVLHPQIKGDITQNQKAMSKLLREASRVFTTLSANTEIYCQIENLFEGQDFSTMVTRSDLEMITTDLFELFRQPFMDALRSSKLDALALREIVLMGGGTRVPKVQSILMELGNRSDLGKGVNNDEAAVLGAVYQAAARTPGFRVLPFIVREYNAYPIAVFFKPTPTTTDVAGTTDSNATYVHRLLFVRGNPYPQKRAITFNRHADDLSFFTSYVDLDRTEAEFIPVVNLSAVTTIGVGASVERNPRADLRGIKAYFTLDHNGLLLLTGIDCLFSPSDESTSTELSDESTLQKLGSKISGLFGSIGGSGAESNGTGVSPDNATYSQNITDGELGAQFRNETKPMPKKSAFTERISFQFQYLDSPTPTGDHISATKERLLAFRQADQARRDWENAMNELESLLFSARHKLDSDAFKLHSTEEEVSTLTKILTDYTTWLDEQGAFTAKEEFLEKRDEIRRHLMPIELRVNETEHRPRAILELTKELTAATEFLEMINTTMSQFSALEHFKTTDDQKSDVTANSSMFSALPTPFTDTEQSSLLAVVKNTRIWLEETQRQMTNWSPFERPPILISDIEEKQRQVKREMHYLNKKLTQWRRDVERLLALRAAEEAAKSTTTPTQSSKTPHTSTRDEINNSSRTAPETAEDAQPSTPEKKDEL